MRLAMIRSLLTPVGASEIEFHADGSGIRRDDKSLIGLFLKKVKTELQKKKTEFSCETPCD